MPVSDKNKCIFIHIPRTAGSSIEEALLRINTTGEDRDVPQPEVLFGLIPDKLRKSYDIPMNYRELQHLNAVEVRKIVTPGKWGEYYKFAFVRNPWDRLVSWYYYLNRTEDFDEWIQVLSTEGTPFNDDRVSRSQLEWITDKNGENMVDYVGRFENLEVDYKRICNKLGLKVTKLPFIRKTNHRFYREYYNLKSKKRVSEMFYNDIAHFNYEF